MLVQFSVENYKSFKEESTLTFLASSDRTFREECTFEVNAKTRLNKTSVLYGANASGKSNFFKAFRFFLEFAVNSGPRKQKGEAIETDPFLLDTATVDEPSTFELIFYIQKNGHPVRYRYGFSVDREKIVQEYLFAVNTTRESELFFREGQKIEFSQTLFREGNKVLQGSVRNNATFLSVCAQANGEISGDIIDYFREIRIFSGSDDLRSFIVGKNTDDKLHSRILNFLHYADLLIDGFQKVELIPGNPEFVFGHPVYENGHKVGLSYIRERDESSGTKKLFYYSGVVFDVLDSGGILFVDEFDSSLHPLLVESLMRIFNSSLGNPNNAQVFVSCHDSEMMKKSLFRRDQIWFCERNRFGASDLYSLSDYKEPVRKDASYSKNYLYGKYGSIPTVKEGLVCRDIVDGGKTKKTYTE